MPLALTMGTLALWHHLNDLHPALVSGNFRSDLTSGFLCMCVYTAPGKPLALETCEWGMGHSCRTGGGRDGP